MLSEEEVKQVAEELGKSIVDGDKYGIIPSLFDYIQGMRGKYNAQPYDDNVEGAWDFFEDSIVNKALDILNKKHVLSIVGYPGNGKTTLAKFLAEYYTGYKIDIRGDFLRENVYYDRVCYYKATTGEAVYSTGPFQKGILNKYIDYIKENNIVEPCVFICDEIQVYGLKALFGELFNCFDKLVNIPDILPSNLYIICCGLHLHLDENGFKRIDFIKLHGYTSIDIVSKRKLLDKFRFLRQDAEEILDLIGLINDNCIEQVITYRQIIDFFFSKEKNKIITNLNSMNYRNKTKIEDVFNLLKDKYNVTVIDKETSQIIK